MVQRVVSHFRAALRHQIRAQPWLEPAWVLLRARQQERYIRQEQRMYEQQAAHQRIPRQLEEDELGERLHQRLAARGSIPQRKRKGDLHIIYASPLGNWEKHNIPPALAQFGVLTPFYLSDHGFDDRSEYWLQTRHRLDAALLQFVTETHKRHPVDVIVCYLSGWHIAPATIQAINRLGIVSCAFWWDDRLYFRGGFKGGRYNGACSLAAAYDMNLTNATASVVKYLAEGGLAMFWPPGANPEHFRPLDSPFLYDVSFIGACYGQRPNYISYLKRHGIQVEAFGPGWPAGSLSEHAMIEVYARSRINLGFSGIGYSMQETCLKGREFEVPMCGALYLTSAQPDLSLVYNIGQEVAVYRHKQDCGSQLRYLLARPDTCADMRRAAHQYCIRHHTWEQRFQQLFHVLGCI